MNLARRAIRDRIAAFALCSLFCTTATAEPPAADISERDASAAVERLLLLTPGQPLRIDLALELGGQPLGVVWRERIDQLISEAAQDENGTLPIATAVEIVDLAGGFFGLMRTRTQISGDLQQWAKEHGGNARISRDSLLEFISHTFPPFTVTAGSAPGSAAAPALFGLLDVNGDGRLSRDELAAAERRLAVRDFDDDELISERELIVDPTQGTAGGNSNPKERAPLSDRVIWISPTSSPDSVVTAIVRRYDRDGDGGLSLNSRPAEISFPTAVAQRLDADQDGNLNANELRALVAEPAAAVLQLSFGSAGPIRRGGTANGESNGLRVRRKLEGGYKLHLDNVQIDVNRNNRDPRQFWSNLPLTRFDADQNGYLDRAEMKASPYLAAAFDGMDSDHDEKVMPGEYQVYVDGQNATAAVRLRLRFIDRGQDLFSVLDANGDGLLTPREQRAAPGLIDADDQDSDGSLGGSKIPFRWSLDIERVSVVVAAETPVAMRVRAPQLAAGEAGPEWFRNMDRNHDGDLTPREFLGTAADFSAADSNHDGFIDAEEAAALSISR